MLRILRDAVRDAMRVDASAITPWQGLRVAGGVVIALVAGTLSGGYAVGAAAAAGSLSAGLAGLDVEGRPRLWRVTATCAGMAVATFIGTATGTSTWVHALATVAWVGACGYLAAVEPLALAVGINSIIAFLVFGRFAASSGDALRAAGFVAAGAAMQLLLSAGLRLPPSIRRELRFIGEAYGALGRYAASIASGGSSLAAAGMLEAARAAVVGSAVRGTSREAWESLVDEAWRIRLQLIAMSEARVQLDRGRADADRLTALDAALAAAGSALTSLGEALAIGADPGLSDQALAHLAATIALLGDASELPPELAGTWRLLLAAADALAGQLRAARALVTAATSWGPAGLDPRSSAVRIRLQGAEGATALAERLVANASLESAAMRHAIRLATTVLVATLIAHVLGLERGYWIGVTAALVLRPDFSATMSRGLNRAAGTVLGVGIASLLAVTVHPEGVLLGVVIGSFTWVAASTLSASYFLFSVAITGTVVFLLATVDPSPVHDAEQRLLSTAIGAVLALIAYAVWPTWGRENARRSLVDLVAAERGYVVRVLEAVADPEGPARGDLGSLDRRLRRARTNAEASVEASLADPASHRVDEAWARGVLAALRRLSLAAHALRSRLSGDEGWPSMPAVTPLAAALGGELDGMAAAIASDVPVHSRTGALRALHGELRDALGGREGPREWVLLETDEVVDAAGTLLHLLGGEAAPEATADAAVRV